jgi:putative protease
MYENIINQVKELSKLEPDGVIVADGGILEIVKEYAPNLKIHISTQSNVVTAKTANFWANNGAERVILGRELSKTQIQKIIENKQEG